MGISSKSRRAFMTFTADVLFGAALAHGQSGTRVIPVPAPPLGWSSWNSFSNTVNSQNVIAQARAMASKGMLKAGYQYINIDEGWWMGKRDAEGNILVDETAWPAIAPGEKPGDMANISRFIHSLGLKAGIYTDAGRDGCSMYPDIGPKILGVGSEGHYEQDFLQFARWGFDFVKVDWCGGDKEGLDPAAQYAQIVRAIAKAEKTTGHRLYLSLCEWGKNSPWTWAPHVGGVQADIWRVSGDIVDPIVAGGPHADRKASFDKMLANFDRGIHPEAEHTGFYNDPDMMVVGMPDFTAAQNRVHVSLWAISGAPLLVGADLTTLTPDTLSLLTNPAVLAVDQDPLGLQGVLIAEPVKGAQVWSKPLAKPGSRAVVLLNRTAAATEIAVNWKDLGLADHSTAKAKNLFTGEELSSYGTYSAVIPPGDALLLRVEGADAPSTLYKPSGGAKRLPLCRGCELRFDHVQSSSRWVRVHIAYINPSAATRYAELRVNDHLATWVAFPPTGAVLGAVTVEERLDREGSVNLLSFSAFDDAGPAIDSINVQ